MLDMLLRPQGRSHYLFSYSFPAIFLKLNCLLGVLLLAVFKNVMCLFSFETFGQSFVQLDLVVFVNEKITFQHYELPALKTLLHKYTYAILD